MISIVITYHNRREQFLRTLKSIKYFGDPEIIVVDDASDQEHRLEDIGGITLIRIAKEDKKWTNTCVPYNMGLAKAKGDVIIIQNAECMHTGDILSYCKNLKRGVMFSFAAYSLDWDLPYTPEATDVREVRKMVLREPPRTHNGHHGWYNHTVHRPVGYHFCNAMLRVDLERVGGFDERYAPGLAYEDDEFLTRTKRAGINVQIIDDPFVVHQKHPRTDYGVGHRKEYLANKTLFETMTAKGTFVKPPSNKIYAPFNNPATTTHIPLTRAVLKMFEPKYIMELGIGWHSSAIFNDYKKAHPDVQYIGIENDKVWLADVRSQCPLLDFVYHDMGEVNIRMFWNDLSQYQRDVLSEYYGGLTVPEISPKLLFVDNYGSCRVIAFNTLKEKFDFIIIHDCELAGAFAYSYDRLNSAGYDAYYLKNNLSWTVMFVRKGIDISGISGVIDPFVTELTTEHPEIQNMRLEANYL